jgi:hypothetical protein
MSYVLIEVDILGVGVEVLLLYQPLEWMQQPTPLDSILLLKIWIQKPTSLDLVLLM